jgi:hypothetical protein
MGLEARIQSLVSSADAIDNGTTETTESDSASESESTNAPLEGASESGAESASADEGSLAAEAAASPEAPTTGDEALRLKHQILNEKLEALREENRLRRERLESEELAAKRAREEAEADRKAAAEERARFEGLKKKGSIKDTLTTLGMDPREAFEAMKAEALEAGSPEAVERRLRAELEAERDAIKKQLEESLTPLKTELEALKKEREEIQKQAAEAHFSSTVHGELADPQYINLRAEYDDNVLLGVARKLRDNPEAFAEQVKLVGLTNIPRTYNMSHILQVLKATQDQHEERKRQNLAKLRPSEAQQTAPTTGAPAKTVNGTTEKRNAGSALGNDLASARASGAPDKPKLTWEQRVAKLAEGR